MASGEADLAKKVKNLRKKLRQIELEERLGEGLSLNDEQTGKIVVRQGREGAERYGGARRRRR